MQFIMKNVRTSLRTNSRTISYMNESSSSALLGFVKIKHIFMGKAKTKYF